MADALPLQGQPVSSKALHQAAYNGDFEDMLALLEGGFPVDAPDTEGQALIDAPPLMIALIGKTPFESAKCLLLAKADPNGIAKLPTGSGHVQRPLGLAINNESIAQVKLLLEHGADPGLQAVTSANMHAFAKTHATAEHAGAEVPPELSEIIELLQPWEGAGGVAEATEGETDLMRACKDSKVDEVRSLLAQGAEVNAKNGIEMDALMYAAGGGDGKHDDEMVEIVRMLLAEGADPKAVTKDQSLTALSFNAMSGIAGTTRLLLDAGAHLNAANNQQTSAILQATVASDEERLSPQILEKHPELDKGDGTLRALLEWRAAMPKKGVDALEWHKAADSDFVSRAMGLRAHNGSLRALRTLVEHAPDCVNRLSDVGIAPLMVAAAVGRVEAMEILLGAGADPNLTDRISEPPQTALDMGRNECDPELLGAVEKLLLDHGAADTGRLSSLRPEDVFTVRDAKLRKAGGFMGTQWQERQVIFKSDRTLEYHRVKFANGRTALELAGAGRVVRALPAAGAGGTVFSVTIKCLPVGGAAAGELKTIKLKTESAGESIDWIMTLCSTGASMRSVKNTD